MTLGEWPRRKGNMAMFLGGFKGAGTGLPCSRKRWRHTGSWATCSISPTLDGFGRRAALSMGDTPKLAKR